MNIKELSLVELKAMVYDQIANKENAERNIGILNQEISIRLSAQPVNLPATGPADVSAADVLNVVDLGPQGECSTCLSQLCDCPERTNGTWQNDLPVVKMSRAELELKRKALPPKEPTAKPAEPAA